MGVMAMETKPMSPDSPAAGVPFTWQHGTPASQGMSVERLQAIQDDLARHRTHCLLIVRRDRIVWEWYAPEYGPHRPHYTASLAKALVGGTSLMVALNERRIGVDDPACKYIPGWKEHPLKAKITIRHLATHSSGLEDAEEDGKPHEALTGWKGAFWKRTPDPFSIALRQAPVRFEPGTRYAYSNPGMAALAYAVTESLRSTPQPDLRSLLKQRIMDPIGVAPEEWSIGYGRAYELDGLQLYANWGGGGYSARAAASVGRLMLRRGDWQGRPLVAPRWVRKVTAYAGTPLPDRSHGEPEPASGLGWWTNSDGVWPELPRDAFAGAGAGHQLMLVVPSLDLIVVRFGDSLAEPGQAGGFWGPVVKRLFNPLMAALSDESKAVAAAKAPVSPYPPSPVITKLTWAPASSIVRLAYDCDNWPLTWADDDHLYTVYGDGYGFEPRVPEKLSLGLARIEGPPSGFTGTNIRSPSIEQRGEGRAGKKASGLLMVSGVLYMWVRNAANAQLAWSTDHGRSWQWTDWKFTTSFGCPTFLNFGKNYAGARDDYVYIYSADAEDAYSPADRMVLARVPKDRLADRNAYEFFQGIRAPDRPRWTKDIAKRGAVFTNAGRCYRSGISYNTALRRYLWCQILPGEDPRFDGGFGIYDAPEPWGPWTTVFFAEQWDVGPGETCSFPTKWMSADGKTLYLVFSGDDYFSVRKATLTVH
jgi:CubicO group peptidase (beta-lactamase class C family)